jgi:aminoglycoside phosphotransferase (APT) family kinase protein
MPRVHRVLHVEPGDGFWGPKCFIVTDYIQGTCLSACWADLDEASRSSVASQVAAMIREMESITLEVPGPVGGENRSRGVWFSDYGAGPFYTLQGLESWFNHKLDICERYKQAIEGTPRFKFHKLVLTHQDITPRNLILDKSGRVWLIDWAHAGAYPPGFERAALEHQRTFADFSAAVCEKITAYPVVAMQLQSIMYGLTTAALA